MRPALLAIALVVLAGSAEAGSVPKLHKNTSYDSARTSLLALGWKPATVPASERTCERREDTCEMYPEAERCAPSGSGACVMLWSKGGTLISVLTYGDNQVTVTKAVCRVGC